MENNIPRMHFDVNKPQIVELRYDHPIIKNVGLKMRYIYGVLQDDLYKIIDASQNLHDKIQDLEGIRKGYSISIELKQDEFGARFYGWEVKVVGIVRQDLRMNPKGKYAKSSNKINQGEKNAQ